MTDSLDPEAAGRHIKGRFGRPYLYEPECESTQAALLEGGHPEGAVSVTDHQTAGRGRLGRQWVEPAGTSVLVSVVLHPPAGRRPQELSLVAGIATAEAVEGATGLSVQVKWPNDVMLNRRKVAGVLAEMRGHAVVVGIGINVNQTRLQLPADANMPAGSLRTLTGSTFDRAALLGSLLYRLERLYDGWRHGGLADIYTELGPRDFLRGRQVSVDGVSGTAVMIDREGRLLVETGHGHVAAVESGDVTYVR